MTSVKIPSTPTRADSRRPSAVDPTNNQSPTSPFFHNLTSRLRKGSNASSLNAADQSPVPRDPVTRTESTRAARRALQALIRNDWEYPPPSGTTAANANRTVRTPIGYRLREESLSDLENEEIFARRRTKNDPYKFESPESIGNQLAEKRLKRKRAQEEELEWNKGLRTWSQRRDAWTCAVRQRPQDQHQHQQSQASSTPLQPNRSRSSPQKSRLSKSISHERKTSASTSTSNSNTDGSGSISAASTASAGTNQTKPTILSTSPATQNVESSSIDTISSSPTTTTTTTATSAHPSTTQTPSRESSSSSSSSSSALTVPYIPVFPPLLTDSDYGPNSDALALRSRIKTSAYPTIYSKIVVQSLTPNVPIPLNHMISALVDGWKAEGNWPPQLQAQSLGLAGIDGAKKKTRKSAAFLRWRKEHPAAATFPGPGSGSASVPHAIGSVPTPLLFGGNGDILGDAGAGNPDCGADDSKSRVRRSMSRVKRVLSGGSGDGLQELGIEFREQDEEEMEKNVTLKR